MNNLEPENYIGSLAIAMRDSNEEKSGFCNSLNAEAGWCKHVATSSSDDCIVSASHLDSIGDYLLRAEACIIYLKSQLSNTQLDRG